MACRGWQNLLPGREEILPGQQGCKHASSTGQESSQWAGGVTTAGGHLELQQRVWDEPLAALLKQQLLQAQDGIIGRGNSIQRRDAQQSLHSAGAGSHGRQAAGGGSGGAALLPGR